MISRGIDLHVAVEDDLARRAMRALAADGIVSGESGAAGLAGLLEVLIGRRAPELRTALGVDASSQVLVLSTEAATDPSAYMQIVGRLPRTVGCQDT